MPKSPNQKMKLLCLMRIFLEQTDEEHSLTLREIEEELAKYGVSAERKALYHDFRILRAFGIDVRTSGLRPYSYCAAGRAFQLSELKLLVDAVLSSHFIPPDRSAALVAKIESLASRHQVQQLRRRVIAAGGARAIGEDVHRNADRLHAAISRDRQVAFRYCKYAVDRNPRFRRYARRCRVSPCGLAWDGGNCFLIALREGRSGYSHYRVDRMEDIQTLEESRVPAGADPDLERYARRAFGLFAGEPRTVRIRFENRLADAVFDRFGPDVPIEETGDGHFVIRVSVASGPAFYAWIFQLGGSARILSPPDAAARYRAMAEAALAEHAGTVR